MQTGLTSFIDKMIAGTARQPATGESAQTVDGEAGGKFGQGKGQAIAAEFSRIIRALRAETQPGDGSQSGVDRADETDEAAMTGSALPDDAEADADALNALADADDTDADAAEKAEDGADGAQAHGMAAWRDWRMHGPHWQEEASADPSAVEADQENAETGEVDPGIAPPVQVPLAKPDVKAAADDEGAETADITAAMGRSGQRAAINEAIRREGQAGEGDGGDADPAASPDGRQAAVPGVRAGDGARADGGQARAGSDRGAAQEAMARGAGQQVRVDVVSNQTFMPPTQPAPSTVQQLGAALGEAASEVANTRSSGAFGEIGQDGKPAQPEISRRLVIDLHPREFGSVRVSMIRQGGELQIEIMSTTDKAHDLLNSHRDALVQTIRGAGAAVTDITVRVSNDGGMGRDFQQGQNPAFNWNGGDGASGGSGQSGEDGRPTVSQGNREDQQWRNTESRPETDHRSRNGIYL